MTIESAPSEISYATDGVTLAFPIPFPFDTSADIKVILTSSTGTPAELTTGFSISGGGGSTGTCTFDVAPAALQHVTLLDNPELTQPVDYVDNDPFAAETHEGALDRVTRLVKRLHQRVDRSIRVADGDDSSGDQLLLPIESSRAGKFLAFDASGQPNVSSGTGGGDTALRTDLANGTTGPGSDLVAVKRTAAEIAALIVPSNYSKPARDPSRFSPTENLVDAADLFAVFGNPRAKPAGFSYVDGNIFSCAGPGLASHDFDAEANFLATYSAQTGAESTGQYWVDGVNGSDLNTGGFNDPYKTVAACMQGVAGLSVIWLMPGVYTDRLDVRATHNLISAGTVARAVRIKAWGGPGTVIFRYPGQQPGEMLWTLTGGTTAVYEATPTGGELALHVIYKDDNRDVQLQWRASSAAVNANTSGWYQDPATKKFFVRHQNKNFQLPGSAARLEIMYSAALVHIVLGGKVYLEGITFRGGDGLSVSHQIDGANNHRPVLYARNCAWQYLAYHNMTTLGGIVLLQDCLSENSLGGDGFNYNDDTSGTGLPTQVTEIDCIGRYNGTLQYKDFDGVRNKQGSSGHGTSIITRVNGEYYGNYGQSVADTGSGSKSWMVGTICGSPFADLTSGGIGGFYNLWTEGTTYLDNVRSGGKAATYGLYLENGTAKLFNTEHYGRTAIIGKNVGTTGIYDPRL